MTAPVFYNAERLRWAELHDLPISDEWAARALKKLTRHFKLDRMPYGQGPVPMRFGKAGSHVSWGGGDGITLAASRDWLVFLHEVAHVWECRKYGYTRHQSRLAGLVDRLCVYALKMGWPQADLDEQFDAWCRTEADQQLTEAYAVEPEPWPEAFFVLNGQRVKVTDYPTQRLE